MIVQLSNNRFFNLTNVSNVHFEIKPVDETHADMKVAIFFGERKLLLSGNDATDFASAWTMYFELVNKTAQLTLAALNQQREDLARQGVILP
jgi:hypothetical protein